MVEGDDYEEEEKEVDEEKKDEEEGEEEKGEEEKGRECGREPAQANNEIYTYTDLSRPPGQQVMPGK